MKEQLSLRPADYLYDSHMEIAEWIKTSRKQARITQDQLADALGVTRGNVSGWENGRHEPNISQIKRIALLCSSDAAVLFGGDTLQKKTANWPFSVDYAMFAAMPMDERQRINDLVDFSVHKWHSSLRHKSRKTS